MTIKGSKKDLLLAGSLTVMLLFLFSVSQAQETGQDLMASPPVEQSVNLENPGSESPVKTQSALNPSDMPSLLFTYWEYTALQDARRARGSVRPPTAEELARDLRRSGVEEEMQKIKPPPEERELTLGGISYVSAKDWTIWLNGKRITPNAIPEEVIDLKVYNEYIEVKWFDEYTNQIFPLRLRPHERFNIDTRIFLPG